MFDEKDPEEILNDSYRNTIDGSDNDKNNKKRKKNKRRKKLMTQLLKMN